MVMKENVSQYNSEAHLSVVKIFWTMKVYGPEK